MKEKLDEILKEYPQIYSYFTEEVKKENFDYLKFISRLLDEKKLVVDDKLASFLSEIFRIPFIDIEKERINESLISLFIPSFIKKNRFLPIEVVGKKIKIVTDNPFNIDLIKDIQFITLLEAEFYITTTKNLETRFNEIFGLERLTFNFDEKILKIDQEIFPQGEVEKNLSDDEINAKPIVRLVNSIILDAIKLNASDIHFEPQQKNLVVRYRIDGFLYEHLKLPKNLEKRFISRIKIMAKMDITITRKSQDGNIQLILPDREVSLRISTIPIMNGEKVVIRILDKTKINVKLDNLGFSEENIKTIKRNINRSQGIILVTGPTGSGKTTTLYSMINELDYRHLNIITIEDPIEYTLKGINQTQVDPKNNITFSSALKTFLRQDPNVILLGEIRDEETAQIAFKGAITGHLILSTIHTNNEISTIIRLRNLGVEPFLISDALLLVISQRIVRKVCRYCALRIAPDERVREYLKIPKDFKIFQENKNGCEKCSFTGFNGVTGIFGVLEMNPTLRELIEKNATLTEISNHLRKNNVRTVLDDGFEKVINGITTFSEIERVLDIDRFLLEKGDIDTQIKDDSEDIKILVVDDVKSVRTVINALFKSEGFKVFEAGNGNEALNVLNENHIDLVISDVNMPDMDGFELLKRIRENEKLKDIFVVLLTGKSDSENEIEGLTMGADDYITKPIDPQKVLLRVKNILKRGKKDGKSC